MQSFNSFSGLSVNKSKKKQVILKTNINNKMHENDKNSKKVGKKQFLIRKY